MIKRTYQHYHHLERNVRTRHQSSIYALRCMNNYAKTKLLTRYMPKNSPRVLDLACGKGGDVNKIWLASNKTVSRYVGVDLVQKSLDELAERYDHDFVELACVDLTTDSPLPEGEFDFVNMQFALHYMFGRQESCERFFARVSAQMAKGAVFVATTLDSKTLRAWWREKGDVIEFKDDQDQTVCRITKRHCDDEGEWYGREYEFQLWDESEGAFAVNSPEWLVPLEAVEFLAERSGLEVLDSSSLRAVVLGCETDPLYRKMVRTELSACERKILNLYRVFVLRKK